MNPAEWAKIGDKYKNPRERLIYFAKGLRFGEEYQILAWIGIGNAQIVLRDYVQAVNAFQRVLSLKKDNISALIGLGTALFLRGDYQNAIKQLNLIQRIIYLGIILEM